ncbi:DUF7221 family queuine tRNA-ribosyltransferase-like protein [Caldisericum sp.]|uniref:deazapurine DNA modification protein DpdA family protein n=1 Tax=Caldisericum sp. TaxID=2499687 RepID=UPI003D0E38F0
MRMILGASTKKHVEKINQLGYTAMVSFNTLEFRKSPISSHTIWIDSGSFTRLSSHKPLATPEKLIRVAQINNTEIVFTPDAMCEPQIIEKTGLDVDEHIRITHENNKYMLEVAEKVNFPTEKIGLVVQGWTVKDYIKSANLCKTIIKNPNQIVGIGTLCRRHSFSEIGEIVDTVKSILPQARIHAFGVKGPALAYIKSKIYSADSFAWAFHRFGDFRYQKICQKTDCKTKCNNCTIAIEIWINSLIKTINGF